MPGASDRVVLQRALEGRAILLTADKDFGRIVVAREAAAAGVVLFRRSARQPDRAAVRLLAAIDKHGERLHDLYLVVTPERVRVRARVFRAVPRPDGVEPWRDQPGPHRPRA